MLFHFAQDVRHGFDLFGKGGLCHVVSPLRFFLFCTMGEGFDSASRPAAPRTRTEERRCFEFDRLLGMMALIRSQSSSTAKQAVMLDLKWKKQSPPSWQTSDGE